MRIGRYIIHFDNWEKARLINTIVGILYGFIFLLIYFVHIDYKGRKYYFTGLILLTFMTTFVFDKMNDILKEDNSIKVKIL